MESLYSIVGADGSEYGPVDKPMLVQWAMEGRIVERTEVREHATGRRFLACDLPELAAVFAPPPVLTGPSTAPPSVYTRYPPPGAPMAVPYALPSPRNKVTAGLLGLLLGFLGVHRFYLGYTGIGIIMVLMSTVLALFTCGLTLFIAVVWGVIEGIICLCGGMPDAEGRMLID